MKRIFLLFILGIAFSPLMAQFNLIYQGTVTVSGTTVPVPNHLVTIYADTLLYAMHDSTYTDVNGHYYDTIHFSPNYPATGVATVSTLDCQNYWNNYTTSFGPAPYVVQHDFHICYNGGDTCHADFTYNQPQPLMMYFYDASSGGGYVRNWNFGDGTTSSIPNTIHSYQQPGNYNVTLSIGTPGQGCTSTITKLVTVTDSIPIPCNAHFADYPNSAMPKEIHFIDQSTGNNIVSWSWNFGDPASGVNNLSAIQNPIHTYTDYGSYMAGLTITTANGCTASTYWNLTVYAFDSCISQFAVQHDSLHPQSVAFWSQAMGNNITTYAWDFGDGTNQTISYPASPNVNHYYMTPGTFTACLTIHCADGCTSTFCDNVTVSSGTCVAQYTYSVNPAPGVPVQFSDLSFAAGGTVTYWQWSFGDGTGSNLQNPSHVFASPGTYSVCLTISGSNCQDTECKYIVVADSSQFHPVYGQIFAGNMPLVSGMAMIFSADSMQNYNPYINVTTVDSLGTYYFSMVPPGNYYIYALPFLPQGYVPTYYGDKLFWEDATIISTSQLNNPYNIHLISADSLFFGPGGINGNISLTGLKTTLVDKVTMLLMNAEGKTITYGQVGATGSFDFSTFAYGTYFVKAEIAGVTSEVIQIRLTADHPQATVNMTFTGTSIMGINDVKASLTAGVIYPNPVNGDAHIQVIVPESMNVTYALYSMTGQVVFTNSIRANSGTTALTLPCSGLPSGIYTLTLTSENGFHLNRKLVITQ